MRGVLEEGEIPNLVGRHGSVVTDFLELFEEMLQDLFPHFSSALWVFLLVDLHEFLALVDSLTPTFSPFSIGVALGFSTRYARLKNRPDKRQDKSGETWLYGSTQQL